MKILLKTQTGAFQFMFPVLIGTILLSSGCDHLTGIFNKKEKESSWAGPVESHVEPLSREGVVEDRLADLSNSEKPENVDVVVEYFLSEGVSKRRVKTLIEYIYKAKAKMFVEQAIQGMVNYCNGKDCADLYTEFFKMKKKFAAKKFAELKVASFGKANFMDPFLLNRKYFPLVANYILAFDPTQAGELLSFALDLGHFKFGWKAIIEPMQDEVEKTENGKIAICEYLFYQDERSEAIKCAQKAGTDKAFVAETFYRVQMGEKGDKLDLSKLEKVKKTNANIGGRDVFGKAVVVNALATGSISEADIKTLISLKVYENYFVGFLLQSVNKGALMANKSFRESYQSMYKDTYLDKILTQATDDSVLSDFYRGTHIVQAVRIQ